jgi:hypothetical protein
VLYDWLTGLIENLSAAAAEDSEKKLVVMSCLVAGLWTVPVDCEDSVVFQESMESDEFDLEEFKESGLEVSMEFDRFNLTRFKRFDIVSRLMVDMVNMALVFIKGGRRKCDLADEQ